MSLNLLLTIAARAGSKGVKGKNIRELMGKPLIAYTIEQAKRWGKAKHIIVTTDSPHIASIAKKYGAEVPFIRPKHLATDKMGKVPVIRHALQECERIFNEKFDAVVDLDVTAPIRSIKDMDNCLKLFINKRPTTIFSVTSCHKNPYFNMFEYDHSGKIKLCKSLKKKLKCRQDAPQVFSANAAIYFYDRNYLLNARDPLPINPRCIIYPMDDLTGVDVDREIDFKFIEFLVKEKLVVL